MFLPLLFRQFHIGVVVCFDGLGYRLCTDNLLLVCIIGQARRTIKLPALAQGVGDAVTEARVVGAGEEAVEGGGQGGFPSVVFVCMRDTPACEQRQLEYARKEQRRIGFNAKAWY